MKVIRKRTRPSSISELRYKSPRGFGELIGDGGSDGVAGRKQRGADGGSVADHHGDGHGFAESARQSEKHRAHNAGARPGDNNFPGGFPASGAEGQGGFALFARDGEQNFARDGNDEGDDHDGENDSGGKKADAVVGAAE